MSVSLLTFSERRATESEARFVKAVTDIEAFAPDAAGRVRGAAATYRANALKAVDAYTGDNQVLGYTYLARRGAAATRSTKR